MSERVCKEPAENNCRETMIYDARYPPRAALSTAFDQTLRSFGLYTEPSGHSVPCTTQLKLQQNNDTVVRASSITEDAASCRGKNTEPLLCFVAWH